MIKEGSVTLLKEILWEIIWRMICEQKIYDLDSTAAFLLIKTLIDAIDKPKHASRLLIKIYQDMDDPLYRLDITIINNYSYSRVLTFNLINPAEEISCISYNYADIINVYLSKNKLNIFGMNRNNFIFTINSLIQWVNNFIGEMNL